MALPLWLTLGVLEGLEPAVSEAVREALSVELAESVVLGVGAGVPELVPVEVPEAVGEGVGTAVALPDSDVLPVFDCEAPKDSDAVGEALSVELEELVEEGVDSAVLLLLLVGVPDDEAEGVEAGVTLLVRDSLGVLDELAPAERDAVGVALSVELADRVDEGVGAAVLLLLPVGVPDVVADGVEGGVTLPERDTLGEVEGLEPAVSDAVALLDTVLLPLRVLLAVPLGEVVGDGVLLPVGLADGVAAALLLPDREMLAVFEGLAPAVSDGVGEALSVELALAVVDAVEAGVLEPVGVGVPVAVCV